jgi:hypothetical protein
MRRRLPGAAAAFCGLRFGPIHPQALCSALMKRKPIAMFLGALLVAAAASATTYVRVEKDGTKTYSDRPMPGGQPVDLEPAQTYSAPQPASPSASPASRETQLVQQMDDFRYESCEITPKKDEQIANPQSVSIQVDMKPLLRAGDVVSLTVDGVMVSTSSAVSFVMSPAHRGTHTVAVQVKDRFGRPKCNASSQFHVFQPGLNSPARRPPAPPPKK